MREILELKGSGGCVHGDTQSRGQMPTASLRKGECPDDDISLAHHSPLIHSGNTVD